MRFGFWLLFVFQLAPLRQKQLAHRVHVVLFDFRTVYQRLDTVSFLLFRFVSFEAGSRFFLVFAAEQARANRERRVSRLFARICISRWHFGHLCHHCGACVCVADDRCARCESTTVDRRRTVWTTIADAFLLGVVVVVVIVVLLLVAFLGFLLQFRLLAKDDKLPLVVKKLANVAFIVEFLSLLFAVVSFAIGLSLANFPYQPVREAAARRLRPTDALAKDDVERSRCVRGRHRGAGHHFVVSRQSVAHPVCRAQARRRDDHALN